MRAGDFASRAWLGEKPGRFLQQPYWQSSLGWLPENLGRDWIRRLMTANALVHRLLGVAGCAINRYDTGHAVLEALNDPEQVLQSRALKAIGELKRGDLMPLLRQRYHPRDDVIRFWSCWSRLLIGDRTALQPLREVSD
jgi:hypothetical protein